MTTHNVMDRYEEVSSIRHWMTSPGLREWGWVGGGEGRGENRGGLTGS